MKNTWTRLALMATLVAATAPALLSSRAAAADRRVFLDSAGRRVEVPARVERVFAAGPLGTVLVYTLARDRLLGWYRPLTLDERGYIPARYAELPTLGKLTGRSNTPNLDVVRSAQPDVIFDYGIITPAYVELADRVQRETGVPYLLVDGSLAGIPRAYDLMGDVLGVPDRAKDLARYAAHALAEVDERVARVPADKRPRVYYARGQQGLETELIETLDRLGARNVAAERVGRIGPLVTVTRDEVLAWNPDGIVTISPVFARAVGTDPAWQGVKAIRDGRIHVAPLLPFAWLDLPPSVNRLIGLRWLGRVLYPELFPEDLRQEARTFYSLFYQHDLDERQLDALLGGSQPGRP